MLSTYPRKLEHDHSEIYTGRNVPSSPLCNNSKRDSPNCPSAEEWINILWYIRTTEYYTTMKKERTTYTITWMHLTHIILSERSQAPKRTCYIIPFKKHESRANEALKFWGYIHGWSNYKEKTIKKMIITKVRDVIASGVGRSCHFVGAREGF